MGYLNFGEVLKHANQYRQVQACVCVAEDINVLMAIKRAVELNFIHPYLIGDQEKILKLCKEIEFKKHLFEVIHAETEEEAAILSARLAHHGITQLIIKGLINSSPFLKAVLQKENDLRDKAIISHLAAFEIPGYHKLLYLTDGGINVSPNLSQKEDILLNAINFLRHIGYNTPKVALLSANERISEKMPVTVDCQQIVDRAKQGVFGSVKMEGPISLDLAIDKNAIKYKGIQSEMNGEADLFLVPTIESGNIFAKAITYFANGSMAGIVLGAKVPLVLTSRSDSAYSKLVSIAMAVLATQRKGNAQDVYAANC